MNEISSCVKRKEEEVCEERLVKEKIRLRNQIDYKFVLKEKNDTYMFRHKKDETDIS